MFFERPVNPLSLFLLFFLTFLFLLCHAAENPPANLEEKPSDDAPNTNHGIKRTRSLEEPKIIRELNIPSSLTSVSILAHCCNTDQDQNKKSNLTQGSAAPSATTTKSNGDLSDCSGAKGTNILMNNGDNGNVVVSIPITKVCKTELVMDGGGGVNGTRLVTTAVDSTDINAIDMPAKSNFFCFFKILVLKLGPRRGE